MRKLWENSLGEEISYWEKYISTRGSKWPEEFQMRLDPESELKDELILQRLGTVSEETVEILDVGAGPMTVLGKTHRQKTLKITAVDALAEEYDRLLADAGIVPPVRTLPCHGELLLQRFEPRSFNFVYARNCLDHSYDPLLVIQNMVELAKPGQWVVMRHEVNVGHNANYVGLHNWNFEERGGHLMLWSRTAEHNVSDVLRDRAKISCHRYDRKWIACVLTKSV